MPRGRKPKPGTLHVLHGRPGRRKGTDADGALEPELPKPPEWLSERALIAWSEIGPVLVTMRVMTIADRYALALLCEAVAEWRDCLETIENEGRTYTAIAAHGGESERPHPAVAMAGDAWRRCDTMLANFGLNPSARTRVRSMPTKHRNRSLGDFMRGD